MRMIRESWINYSSKAAASHYVKKAEFGINKHFCLRRNGRFMCELFQKLRS